MGVGLLSVTLLAWGSQSTPTGKISVSSYRTAIHLIRTQLDHDPTVATAHAAGQRLSTLRTVTLPNGSVLRNTGTDLVNRLSAAHPADLPQLRTRLAALDTALRTQAARSTSTADLHSLASILAAPVFHPVQNPVQRVLNWLGDLLSRALSALARLLDSAANPRSGTGVSILVLAPIFLVVVAVLGVLLARGITRRMATGVGPPTQTDEPTTFGAAEERATRGAAAGDYRGALRYLVLATILDLQERDLIDLRPGLTNQEYLRDLRRQAEQLRNPLAELVDAFDRVWYGHEDVSPEKYHHYETLARAARVAARRSVA